jgi:hypothetical protein
MQAFIYMDVLGQDREFLPCQLCAVCVCVCVGSRLWIGCVSISDVDASHVEQTMPGDQSPRKVELEQTKPNEEEIDPNKIKACFIRGFLFFLPR